MGWQASLGTEGTTDTCPRGRVAPKVAERNSNDAPESFANNAAPLASSTPCAADDGDEAGNPETMVIFPESTCGGERQI